MPIELQQYQQPQVQQQAMPSARVESNAPAEAFGGGKSAEAVGEATRGVTNSAESIIDIEKKKADQVATMNANMQLTKLKNDLIYNPQGGLMTMKGQDAFAAPDKVMSSFDDQASKIAEGLSNDQQKFMFQHILNNHKAELDAEVQKHVSTEAQRFDQNSTDAAIDTAKEDAVLNYHDDGKVQGSLETQKALIADYGKRQGWNDQMITQKQEDLQSKTLTGVVDRMLANGDDRSAKVYYDANKDKVASHDAIQLEKALEEGSTRGESQRRTDSIMDQGLTMTQALEKVKEIDDPKLRDATQERVRTQYGLQEAAKRDAAEKQATSQANLVDQNPDRLAKDVIAPAQWAQMSIADRERIETYAANQRKKEEPLPNGEEFYQLKTLAATPETKDEFLKTNLRDHINDMPKSELHELIELQANMRSGKHDKQLDGFLSDKQIVDASLADAGFNPHAKPGTDQSKQVNLFRSKVDTEVQKFEERTGKKPKNDDIKRISDDLMIQGRTDDGFFGFFSNKKHLFQVNDDTKKFVIEANSIPAGERSKIADALKRHGIEVSDKNVLDLYKRRMGGMSGNQ